MDPLDDLLTQLEGVEEEELKPVNRAPRLLNMEEACENQGSSEKPSDSSSKNRYEDDDSDDEELYVKKR